jgi:urease accessory protein
VTFIGIREDGYHARLELRAGTVVPRLITRSARSARVALVAGGALLLGGDTVDISVSVVRGCQLELEDIGGTVAYSADGVAAHWNVTAAVEEGATLVWHGLPLVVATGAHVLRSLAVEIAATGTLCVRETLVLGRSSECGGEIESRTSVKIDGSPAFIEHLVVSGAAPTPGIFGSHRVLDSILLLGFTLPKLPTDATVLRFELENAASQDAGGGIVRQLVDEAHESSIDDAWDYLISAYASSGRFAASVPT